LNDGLRRPLTLVSAPAGCGKTTLLADWLASVAVPVAWLSLDEGDGDLACFVEHLVAALQMVAPAVGRSTLGLLRMSGTPAGGELATELGDELLALPDDVVLVLDDYQTIDDRQVDEVLAALLRYPPPRLRLVLASRVDPFLPLVRLRAHGLLTEVRAADLRFTDDETCTLLREATHREPDAELVAMLQVRTEGWIAGLRLATIALRDGSGSPALTTAEASMRAFLGDDVVDVQPEAVRRFLLRTSVPERLCAELCASLLDEGAAPATTELTLESLERAGLFLEPLGEDRTWYRYHHLFRDLLLRRLTETEGGAECRRLHGRASAWFAAHDQIEEAIRHALAAGDPTAAVELVAGRVQRALAERRWLALERWLRLLPPEQVRGRADLLLAQAWVYQLRGDFDALATTLDRITALLDREEETTDPAAVERWRAEAHLLRMGFVPPVGAAPDALLTAALRVREVLPWQTHAAADAALYFTAMAKQQVGDLAGAIRLLTGALTECAGRSDPFALHHAQGANIGLMIAWLSAGDLARSRRAAEELLELATAHGLGWGAAAAHAFLGLIAYEQDRLNDAIGHLKTAVDEPEVGSLVLHRAFMELAMAYEAAGQRAAADAAVNRCLDRFLATGDAALIPTIRSFQARLAVGRGELAPARRWLQMSRVGAGSVHSFEDPMLTRAKILLATGAPADLLAEMDAALDGLARRVDTVVSVRRRIDLFAHRALVQQAQGRVERALATIAEALELAEPRGFFRTFVELGAPMATLLEVQLRQTDASPLAARVLAAIRRPAAANGSEERGDVLVVAPALFEVPLVERLTDRELDVLAGLAKRLSNKEIAEDLGISPFTVKRHTASLYGKLGASGRRQAVRQATSAGLISTV
jgi:LuxR family maltose regulon positive regulatory protein